MSSPAAKGEEVPPAEHRGAHAPGVLRYGAGLYLTTFLALLGFACAQELWAGFWQDRCSFGPVSNERYRELLSQAQAMRRTQGALLDQRNTTDPVSGRRRSAIRAGERSASSRSVLRDASVTGPPAALVAFDYERFHLFGWRFMPDRLQDRASVNLLRTRRAVDIVFQPKRLADFPHPEPIICRSLRSTS